MARTNVDPKVGRLARMALLIAIIIILTFTPLGYLVIGPIAATTIQMPVIIGAAEYPQNLVDKMKAAGIDLDAIDALSLAEQAGSSKAVNLVLMGKLSTYFDIPTEEWLRTIETSVPEKFLEMNKKAFTLGANA